MWLPARFATDEQLIAPLADLPAILRTLGADSAQVLASCGLSPDALDDPSSCLPFSTIGALLDSAARHTGCEHIGLLVGERFSLARWGILGALASSAPTLGDAFASVSDYQRLYSGAAVAFLDVDGDTASVFSAVNHPDTLGLQHIVDVIGQMIHRGLCELVGDSWRPASVLLARRRPRAIEPYRRAFGCEPEFDADCTGVRFAAAALGRALPSSDAARFAEVEASLAAVGPGSLLDALRRALRVELVRGHANASRVSNFLAMHQRTLHRRLAATGTSFQCVLDEVRYDAARHYLRASAMPLVDVAAALGYSELSAFTRAFRRWSGMTPGAFRRRTTAGASTRSRA
jgi:AraC-like DNA-binding protein